MGMVFCRGCGKEIHETAITCPQCGAPQNVAIPKSRGSTHADISGNSTSGNEYISALKKYAVFSGRATRKEYWMIVLYNLLISFALGFVEGIIGSTSGAISTIYSLALFIPSIAVGVRRMHDTNRSGWWLLVPIANLVFLCQKSEDPDATEHSKMSGWAVVAIVFGGLVPIVGILAAIALPAYQDYTVRARIAEVLINGSAAKVSVAEYIERTGEIPQRIEDTGYSTTTKYAESVKINPENGEISIVVNFSPIQGQSIILSPSLDENKKIVWKCYSQDIKQRYVPQMCRQ